MGEVVKQLARKLFKSKLTLIVLIIIFGAGMFILGNDVGDGTINIKGYKSQNSGLPNSLDYSTLTQVYRDIRNDYDGSLNAQQLLDGAKSGLAQATGDPYTEYFSPQQAVQFNNQLSEQFSGIGAELGQDANNDIIVQSPIPGFPADKAGLRSNDIVTTINGTSTNGMTIDQAVIAIRGPVGSKVTLNIIRGSQSLTFTITRANIQVPSVKTQIINGNIGYMQINQFTQDDTANLAQQAAEQFKNQHVKGIILDLRDNPGGIVDAATSVASLWVPSDKLIFQEKRGSTVITSQYATGNDILNGIPTVVLINSGSASASEITAGALHDNGEAYLIGEKSFGKGVVQEILTLPDQSELKITIASWYRPNGQNINHIGITPDKTVTMSDSDYKNNLDPQKDAAVTWLEQH